MITELLKNSGRNSDEKNHFDKWIFSCPNIDQHQRKCLKETTSGENNKLASQIFGLD